MKNIKDLKTIHFIFKEKKFVYLTLFAVFPNCHYLVFHHFLFSSLKHWQLWYDDIIHKRSVTCFYDIHVTPALTVVIFQQQLWVLPAPSYSSSTISPHLLSVTIISLSHTTIILNNNNRKSNRNHLAHFITVIYGLIFSLDTSCSHTSLLVSVCISKKNESY